MTKGEGKKESRRRKGCGLLKGSSVLGVPIGM